MLDAPPGTIQWTRYRGNSLVSLDSFTAIPLSLDQWSKFYSYGIVTFSEIRVQVSFLDDAPVDPVTVVLLPISSTASIVGSIDQICELPKVVWKTLNRNGNGVVVNLTNRAST